MVRALASHHGGLGDIIIMWVKFVVGSQLWSKRFIFRKPSFPVSKPTIFKFQLDQEWQTKSHYIDVLLLNHYCIFIYLLIIIISRVKNDHRSKFYNHFIIYFIEKTGNVLVITCISVLLLISQVLLLLASLFFSHYQQHV